MNKKLKPDKPFTYQRNQVDMIGTSPQEVSSKFILWGEKRVFLRISGRGILLKLRANDN